MNREIELRRYDSKNRRAINIHVLNLKKFELSFLGRPCRQGAPTSSGILKELYAYISIQKKVSPGKYTSILAVIIKAYPLPHASSMRLNSRLRLK